MPVQSSPPTPTTPPTPTSSPMVSASVLALGTFAVGTDAFVMAGLLPDIATDLHVDVAAAGQLVTVFSIAYAVWAVLLGVATARIPRRALLVAALGVFVVGNVLTAFATTYLLILVTRVVAAAGAAVFTAAASSSASRLAGEARRGRAIAVVMFGLTSSLVLGAPLGTALAAGSGWRVSIAAVAALGLLALLAVRWQVPRLAPDPGSDFASLRRLVADHRVLGLLAQTFVVYTAIYLPYTYVSVVFAPSTAQGFDVALVLLVFGLASSLGNLSAGVVSDRIGPRTVVVTALIVVVVVMAAMPLTRQSVVWTVVTVVVFGLAGFAVTTPQQLLLVSLAPDSRAQATSLYQGVLYAAVSAAAAGGAVVLHTVGGAWLGVVAAVIAFVGLALVAADGLSRRTSP